MSMHAFRIVLGSLALSIAVQTIAQTPAAPPPPPTVWDLEFHDSQCTITTGDKRTVGLSVWATPGDPYTQLYIIGSPKVVPRNIGKKLTVVLEPDGKTFQADVDHHSDRDPIILSVLPADEKFAAAFSHADEVRLIGGESPLSVSVRGADQAIVALQQCIDETLPQWGVDPKALAALRKPVTTIPDYPILTGDDYPRDALDKNEAGAVVMRLHVDATGKVRECVVVVSSGSKSLDKPTCDLMLERGKFEPAIGADGKPTDASRIFRAEWSIR